MERELICHVLESEAATLPRRAVVAGWVRTRRDSKGGFSFLELNDGTCLAGLQVLAPEALPNYRGEVLRLHPGAAVVARGSLQPSPGAGQAVELHAEEVRVLGFCDPEDYPLQKKRISFERLREAAHLRPRTRTFGALARVRDALAFATHRFFRERRFLCVHTPVLTAHDCEGAGALFQATTLDLDRLPRGADGRVDYAADFFGRRATLTVSGQLEGEACACALGRIYTFGPTFRAEDSNTRRHLAEFWMVEPEMAFADLNDNVALAVDYLRFLAGVLLEECPEDLAFFNRHVDGGLLQNLATLAGGSFERLTYSEAVAALQAAPVSFEFPAAWGADLQAEHERYLCERHGGRPVVVTDFPKEIKAFYMRENEDGRTVAAMDVLLPRIGEIIGGSQREERLEVLQRRLREAGLDPDAYAWYADLRRFGSAPHAGFGLGFERMVQYATGLQNIRDAIAFPRTPGQIAF